MKRSWMPVVLALCSPLLVGCGGSDDWTGFRAPPSDLEFSISLSETLTSEPQDGRLVLVILKQEDGERMVLF